MTQHDFARMAAVFAASLVLATFLGWRGGNSRSDLALMGGLGTAFSALSIALFAA
jgi:hypothetical protein